MIRIKVLSAVLAAIILSSGCAKRAAMRPGEFGNVTLTVMAKPGVQYRGRLETIRLAGEQVLVNRVSIEDYVRGVLPAEVSPSWNMEALKAMAIVVRTYAWQKWRKGAGGMSPLESDSRDQEYCGFRCEHERTNRAAELTAGTVLSHNGEPLPAFSHSCCAGHTADTKEVWGGDAGSALRGSACGWCTESKHYGPWVLLIDKELLGRRLKQAGNGNGKIAGIRAEGETPSGRVESVVVEFKDGPVLRMPANRFRAAVGYNDVRSTRFAIQDQGDAIRISGFGWGHGVGLCQEGARAQAEAGWSCRTILNTYFPGALLTSIRP